MVRVDTAGNDFKLFPGDLARQAGVIGARFQCDSLGGLVELPSQRNRAHSFSGQGHSLKNFRLALDVMCQGLSILGFSDQAIGLAGGPSENAG